MPALKISAVELDQPSDLASLPYGPTGPPSSTTPSDKNAYRYRTSPERELGLIPSWPDVARRLHTPRPAGLRLAVFAPAKIGATRHPARGGSSMFVRVSRAKFHPGKI